MLNIHMVVNGFGERFMKPLIWFIVIIVSFSFFLEMEEDYASTCSTPSFLINDINKTYAYDNRLNCQYILKLDTNQTAKINLIKSVSNMIYPFAPESKKWFKNVSKNAVLLSFIETILLWFFAISFILALWHRIKR